MLPGASIRKGLTGMRTIAHLKRIGLRLGFMVAAICLFADFPAASQEATFPKKTGVQAPGVQHPMAELPRAATSAVKGDPDWLPVTANASWVTSDNVDQVLRIDPQTNRTGVVVPVHKPCSGLAGGFGGLGVPSCGEPPLARG